MNKTAFKPGDGAKPTTELEYRALMAVMQADGWTVCKGHNGWNTFERTLCIYHGVIRWSSAPINEIPLQEALFRGAPDWAVDIVYCNNDFHWRGEDRTKRIGSNSEWVRHKNAPISDLPPIATRPQPATEPVWPEPGSLPPVGAECEYEGSTVKVEYSDDKTSQVLARFPDGQLAILKGYWLKPIQTEREKLIEQLASELGELCPVTEVVSAVVDAGWRPTK